LSHAASAQVVYHSANSPLAWKSRAKSLHPLLSFASRKEG
jgi:hypothetical protein